jgi:hypothetical protein
MPLAEKANQVAARGSYGRSLRGSRTFCGCDRNQDAVPLRCHAVRVGLIQINHHASDQWTLAVTADSYAAYSVRTDRDVLSSSTVGGIREIEQDAIGMHRRLMSRLGWSTESDFDAQVLPIPYCTYGL